LVGHVKILHTDIHLGTELYGHDDPLTGASSRLEDFAAALDHAAEVWQAALQAHCNPAAPAASYQGRLT
jgi:hypothetical protein